MRAESQPAPPVPAPAAKAERLNVYVKDLVLPPEMVREVDAYCRLCGDRSKAQRAHVEECFKLQHFFGGQTIGCVPTPRGKWIVLRGDLGSEELGELLHKVRDEEGLPVVLLMPEEWTEENSCVRYVKQ
jgi:hypothetical protein